MPLVSQPEGQHQLHSMGLWGMHATVWQFGKRKGGGYWASDQKRRVLPVTCDWAPGKLLQGWKMRHPIKSAKCRSFSPILAVGSSLKLLPPQFRDLRPFCFPLGGAGTDRFWPRVLRAERGCLGLPPEHQDSHGHFHRGQRPEAMLLVSSLGQLPENLSYDSLNVRELLNNQGRGTMLLFGNFCCNEFFWSFWFYRWEREVVLSRQYYFFSQL